MPIAKRSPYDIGLTFVGNKSEAVSLPQNFIDDSAVVPLVYKNFQFLSFLKVNFFYSINSKSFQKKIFFRSLDSFCTILILIIVFLVCEVNGGPLIIGQISFTFFLAFDTQQIDGAGLVDYAAFDIALVPQYVVYGQNFWKFEYGLFLSLNFTR